MCLALVMVVAGVSMLANGLPHLAAGLDASQSQQQWIVDAYALTLAAFLLPAGALGDRFGRRRALIIGLIVFGGASALGATAGDADRAHRVPGADGDRRRADHARHAVDDHERVPAGGAGQGGRDLGRLRGHRRNARAAHVGRAARGVLLGLDLPRHRRARGRRAHRGDLRRALHQVERARRPRPHRIGALRGGDRVARARHHRRPGAGLDQPADARRARRRASR